MGANMIGIIGAMEEEISELKANMTELEVAACASMDFCKGKLSGRDVVIVRSGIGKVNAGICAQILADKFQVNKIINTGIAGSLDPAIDIGDLVLSTDALQHDVDASSFGYDVGIIPRMAVSIFKADDELISLAESACLSANPDIKVYKGRVVTGDQFIADKDKKEWLCKNFNPKCTEMEGAAIAQAAYLNNIPFIIIRAISDKADNSAEMDYPEFEAQAIKHTVKLVIKLIQQIND